MLAPAIFGALVALERDDVIPLIPSALFGALLVACERFMPILFGCMRVLLPSGKPPALLRAMLGSGLGYPPLLGCLRNVKGARLADNGARVPLATVPPIDTVLPPTDTVVLPTDTVVSPTGIVLP